MKKYLLKSGLTCGLFIMAAGAFAQAVGSAETTGGTIGSSAMSLASGDITASVSETLYIGPGNYQVDGTWEIYSKNVWISPDAVITGTGTMKFFNPSVAGGTASATFIDGNNNSSYINVNMELQNASNMVLTDIAGPGVPWNDVASNANLTVGANFNFAVTNGDVLLGNYDMITATGATLSNYQPSQFVVTNGTGHLVHNSYSGAFTFPVGIAEGDYTPASVNNAAANTTHVMVQNYAASSALEGNSNGIDRTWNIYADNTGIAATIDLQHNTATNDPHYNDGFSFVTEYSSTAPNTTGQTNTSTTAWQSNTQAAGSGTGTLTTGSTISGASERSLSYPSLPISAASQLAFFTKSSDPVVPLPLQLLSFSATGVNCTASLKWSTATELNIASFEVQRSIDGKAFETTGNIQAKGNNSSYSYTDAAPGNAKLFYRLHIVHTDEETDYSNTIQVSTGCNSMTYADVYPNPVADNVHISGLTPGSLLYITDAAGRAVISITATAAIETVSMTGLPAGTYMLQIIQNNSLVKSVKLAKK